MHSFLSLARAEKKLLRLAGEVARRAGGVSHPIIPQGKQNGHYGRHKGNKRVVTTPQGKQNGIMTAARRTEGALRPRGCEAPSAPSGLVPLRGGTVHSCLLRLPAFRNL